MPCAWIDLSYPLDAATPVFPDAPTVEIEVLETTEQPPVYGRRSLNVTRLSLMVHTGTHMDAPFHFFRTGETIDTIPLDRCIGPALLVDVRNSRPGEEIELDAIAGLAERLEGIHKVVLNTGWARHWGEPGYFTDHPRLSGKSAGFLIRRGVHLVGVDTPSVDIPPFPAHLELLGNGCLIVENLTNLDAIPASRFHLTVLPLRITGRDGSPARAVAAITS